MDLFRNLSLFDREIVVAIDFGTTYTGLAWADTRRSSIHHCISEWPSTYSQIVSSPKVPTQLSAGSAGDLWGFQIPPSAKRSEYFKLRLDDPNYPTSDTLSAEDLTLRYMTQLHLHLKSALIEALSASVVQYTPIRYVMTVPAIWSDSAKQKTLDLAEKAGFRSSRDTYLVSEPEAAAIYTLQNISLAQNDSFVVCDAGGGTVDCISYTIRKISPRLEITEAAQGTGGKCGSSMLNTRFQRHILGHFGREYWGQGDRLSEAMKTFEEFKKTFSASGEPLTLRVQMPNNPSLGVRRNRWTMSQENMTKIVFGPVIMDIIDLVKRQIEGVKVPIKAVLLVGGFGQSQYLKQRIEHAIGSSIRVLQPENGWTAIVRGAAMFGLACVNDGLAGFKIASRTARKHYGLSVTQEYDRSRHDSSKIFKSPVFGKAVPAMSWFIHKNSPVSENNPIEINIRYYVPVYAGYSSGSGSSFGLCCDETSQRAPIHKNSNVKSIGEITIKEDKIPPSVLKKFPIIKGTNKKKYYHLTGVVEARFGSALVKYTLRLEGETHDVVRVHYE